MQCLFLKVTDIITQERLQNNLYENGFLSGALRCSIYTPNCRESCFSSFTESITEAYFSPHSPLGFAAPLQKLYLR